MGSSAWACRARRSVSRPEMPGMRTSEIIMLISPVRRTSSAFSPEATGTVSNFWLVKNESSRLRWLASSSTIRIRGAFREFFPASGAILSIPGRDFQMSDPENRALRFVRQALDFPSVRQHDLLDHRQTQPRPFLVRGDVGLEDLVTLADGNAGPVIEHVERRFGAIAPLRGDLDFTVRIDRLDRVKEQIKEGLPEQLFIGLNAQFIAQHLEANTLLLDITAQRPHHFPDDRTERHGRPPDFPRLGIIDEVVQLGVDADRFIDDRAQLVPNLRGRVRLFRNHLRQPADRSEEHT